jgi:thiol-disulfide isomerase/thioredoxin
MRIWAILFLLAAFHWIGCRSNERPPVQSSQTVRVNGARDSLTVVPIDRFALRKLLRERNGKILFLNVWATWCAPCVEEFPDLIKLSQAYPKNEVEVVGISADYSDEIESKILPFVRKHSVPFRIYVAQFDHQEDFINSLDSSWNGALPASLIYDGHGNQRFFHAGQGTFQQFKEEIEKVRKKS